MRIKLIFLITGVMSLLHGLSTTQIIFIVMGLSYLLLFAVFCFSAKRAVPKDRPRSGD